MNELMAQDGLLILDSGESLGPGNLGSYGINSNTSGQSFLTCM